MNTEFVVEKFQNAQMLFCDTDLAYYWAACKRHFILLWNSNEIFIHAHTVDQKMAVAQPAHVDH